MSQRIVTFDAGQTIIELDLPYLATRLAERGLAVDPRALAVALPGAWEVHDRDVAAGAAHPWRQLMIALVIGAGVDPTAAAPAVEWLWTQQRTHNLWRRPMPEMVSLARELAAAGVRVAVLSNSEGALAELLVQIGIADAFELIVDSGRLAFAKPDRRIFTHTLVQLGVRDPGAGGNVNIVHIGDSWAADVVGARAAGWRAVWFGRLAGAADDPDIASARDAAGVRAVLAAWDVL
jgi:putative hydrolase of the HAD superfamily